MAENNKIGLYVKRFTNPVMLFLLVCYVGLAFLAPTGVLPSRFLLSISAGLSLVGLIITIIYSLFARASTLSSELSAEKIASAERRIAEQPDKATPAWDLARVTLEAYFNRNIAQIAYIFWLSVFVMMAGFAILLWGIYQAIDKPGVITPAIIASIAGIITEFIGATFLFIYRSTIQQAIGYSKTLERINSVGMAMQILDTMPEEASADNLKNSTKATLVKALVQQTLAADEKPQKDGQTPKTDGVAVVNKG